MDILIFHLLILLFTCGKLFGVVHRSEFTFNEDEAALVGFNFLMFCRIPNGLKSPNVRWSIVDSEFYDSKINELDDSVRPGKFSAQTERFNMLIRKMDYTVTGKYTCTVDYLVGGKTMSETNSFRLMAIEKANCGENNIIAEGETLILDCTVAYENNPDHVPIVQWFVDNRRLLDGKIPHPKATGSNGIRRVITNRYQTTAKLEHNNMNFMCRVHFGNSSEKQSRPTYNDSCIANVTVITRAFPSAILYACIAVAVVIILLAMIFTIYYRQKQANNRSQWKPSKQGDPSQSELTGVQSDTTECLNVVIKPISDETNEIKLESRPNVREIAKHHINRDDTAEHTFQHPPQRQIEQGSRPKVQEIVQQQNSRVHTLRGKTTTNEDNDQSAPGGHYDVMEAGQDTSSRISNDNFQHPPQCPIKQGSRPKVQEIVQQQNSRVCTSRGKPTSNEDNDQAAPGGHYDVTTACIPGQDTPRWSCAGSSGEDEDWDSWLAD